MPRTLRLFVPALLLLGVGLGCWWALRSDDGHGSSSVARSEASPPPDGASAVPRVKREHTSSEGDEIAAALAEPAKAGHLTVHVLGADTDAPIAGATVEFKDGDRRDKVRADATGIAIVAQEQWDGLPQVLVTAPGYVRDGWIWPWQDESPEAEVTIRLEPGTALDGIVVDARTGVPLAGVAVLAEDGGEVNTHCFGPIPANYDDAVTGTDGRFRVDGIPLTGETWVHAGAEGRVRGLASWTPEMPRSIELRLETAGTIRGVVRDAAGAPVAAANVYVEGVGEDRWKGSSGTTDAIGAFEVTGLPLDIAYDVHAFAGDWTALSRSDVVHGVRLGDESTVASQDLLLRRPARLVVQIRGPDGVPVGDAKVKLTAPRDDSWESKVDEAGTVRFAVPLPGRCHLKVESSRFLPQEAGLDVEEGRNHTLEIVLSVLPPGVELSGIVVDDLGHGVPGATVRAARSGAPDSTSSSARDTLSGEDGTFVITGCEAANYAVTVEEHEHEAATIADVVAPREGVRLVMRRHGTLVLKPRVRPGEVRPDDIDLSLEAADPDDSIHARSPWEDEAQEFTLAAGRYDVAVMADGFAVTRRTVEVFPGETVDLGEVLLDRGVTLSGRVVDREGRAVPGARVRALVVGAGESEYLDEKNPVATSGAGGAFRLVHLPAGDVPLRVTAYGFVATNVRSDVRPDAAPLVVTMSRGGLLRVQVVDPSNPSGVGDHVAVDVTGPLGDGAPSKPTWLDGDDFGLFAKRLPAGRWHLRVLDSEAEIGTKDVDVREDEETSVEVVVER